MTVSELRSQVKRARAPEHKSQRRSAILRAAEGLLARRDPTDSCSVELLARKAGLAKGTVYLYFRSREEVLLAVHEKQTHELFDVIEGALAAAGASADSVVRTGLRYLRAHPQFYPLAANCRTMLDTNVSAEAALAFKIGIGKRLHLLGERIGEIYPGLRSGAGPPLLLTTSSTPTRRSRPPDPPL